MANTTFEIMSRCDLEDFFEYSGSYLNDNNDVIVYSYKKSEEQELIFSYNPGERSVQIREMNSGKQTLLLSQEGALNLCVKSDKEGKYIFCEFQLGDCQTIMKLRINPFISISFESIESSC